MLAKMAMDMNVSTVPVTSVVMSPGTWRKCMGEVMLFGFASRSVGKRGAKQLCHPVIRGGVVPVEVNSRYPQGKIDFLVGRRRLK